MGRRPEEVSEPTAGQVGERASERVSAPVLSSRSVVLRREIGRTPPRDRSYSAPRSVETRAEIGRNPCRDRFAQLSDVENDVLTRIGWRCVRCDP